MDIDDLKFMVTYPDHSHWSKDDKRPELITENIFECCDVKKRIAESIVALHTTNPTKHQQQIIEDMHMDKPEMRVLTYFGFCWSRAQWEMVIGREVNGPMEKICVFNLFLRPNAEMLLEMIDSVTEKSAKRYLRQWKKEHPICTNRKEAKDYGIYVWRRTPKTIVQRTYRGYTYKITSVNGHPNAYVKLPKTHPLYDKGYDECNDLWDEREWDAPNGQFTYSGDGWLGWDYAHVGDYHTPSKEMEYYFPDFHKNYVELSKNWKRWTIAEIVAEIRQVIEQLKEIENESRQ